MYCFRSFVKSRINGLTIGFMHFLGVINCSCVWNSFTNYRICKFSFGIIFYVSDLWQAPFFKYGFYISTVNKNLLIRNLLGSIIIIALVLRKYQRRLGIYIFVNLFMQFVVQGVCCMEKIMRIQIYVTFYLHLYYFLYCSIKKKTPFEVVTLLSMISWLLTLVYRFSLEVVVNNYYDRFLFSWRNWIYKKYIWWANYVAYLSVG